MAQDWWDREFGLNATLVENGTFLNGDPINRTIPEFYAYYAYSQTCNMLSIAAKQSFLLF